MIRYSPDELPFDERTFLWHVAYLTRANLLRDFGAESCMLTCRVLGDVYREMGLRVLPVVVGVTALNPAAVALARAGEQLPDFREADPSEDAYGISITHRPDEHSEESLCGHLALIVGSDYFVDPSIDQLSRPARGLVIQPLLACFGEELQLEDFMAGERCAITLPDEGLVTYEAHLDDLAYQDGSDWEPIDADEIYREVFDNSIGLADLMLETGKFPPLPDLPLAASSVVVKLIEAANATGITREELDDAFRRHGFDPMQAMEAVEATLQRAAKRQGVQPSQMRIRPPAPG